MTMDSLVVVTFWRPHAVKTRISNTLKKFSLGSRRLVLIKLN